LTELPPIFKPQAKEQRVMPADASNARSCLFRLPRQGGRAIWQITNRCNYRCRYCMFGSGAQAGESELTSAEALRVLEQLHGWGCTALKLTGGEPMMRSDILDIIERACRLGWEVDISTNASLISAGAARRIAATGLKMVHVSLDGPSAAVHEAARGRGTFLPTLRGLTALLEAGIWVRIGCVIFRDNQERLEEMIRFCAGLGAPELVFSLMGPAGRVSPGSVLLPARPVADLASELDLLAQAFNPAMKIGHNLSPSGCAACSSGCPGGERFLFIDNLGRVAPCTWVAQWMPQHLSMLDLRHHSLSEILVSRQLASYRLACADDLLQRAAHPGAASE
jgi:AdoMet-dependent heme synthase